MYGSLLELFDRPHHDVHRPHWREISLVPWGANNKPVLIAKEFEMPKKEILDALLKTPLEDEAKIDQIAKEFSLKPEAVEVLKSAVRLAKGFEDVIPPKEFISALAKASGYPVPEPDARKMEKEDPDQGKKKQQCSGYPIRKSADGEFDLSQVPEEYQAIVKQAWIAEERAAKAESRVDGLVDEKLTKEYIEKAGDLKGLPIKKEDFGPVLKGIFLKAPEEFARLMPVLKAASNAVKTSKLYKSHGSAGEGMPQDPFAQLQEFAKQYITKDASMTPEEALEKAMEDHQDLVELYEASLPGSDTGGDGDDE